MSVATPRTLGGEVRVALEAELVSHTAAGFRFVPRPITGVVEDDGAGVAWGRRSGGGGRDGGEGAGLLIRGGRRRRRRRRRRRVLHDHREGTPAVPAPAPVASARARALSIRASKGEMGKCDNPCLGERFCSSACSLHFRFKLWRVRAEQGFHFQFSISEEARPARKSSFSSAINSFSRPGEVFAEVCQSCQLLDVMYSCKELMGRLSEKCIAPSHRGPR